MSRGDHKVSKITGEAIFTIRPISSTKFLISSILCLSILTLDIQFSFSNHIRGFAHDLLFPIYKIAEIPQNIFNTSSEALRRNKDLRERLEFYRKENLRLVLINSQLKDLTERNKELGLLWDSAQQEEKSYLLARKVFLSSNPLQPSLILKVEDPRSSVFVNQPVLSNEGIIGKIKSVGKINKEVMLAQDPKSLIPVISSTSRLHGILKGRGLKRKGLLVNIKKTTSLNEGELLYSSGLGEVFPPNFLVGKIIKVEEKVDSEFLSVEVEFLSLPERLDYFLIFNKERKDD
tara:strand:+ start:16141 stop:17010 length:870 start_codon:yes stop_codon:yes gene_type:complete